MKILEQENLDNIPTALGERERNKRLIQEIDEFIERINADSEEIRKRLARIKSGAVNVE